jgi:hypothetical protein
LHDLQYAMRVEPFMEPSGSERTLQSVENGRIRRQACLNTHLARVKRYRPDKDARKADTIDDLRALLPARAGDEFHASGSSKEVLNRKDEHPEEER